MRKEQDSTDKQNRTDEQNREQTKSAIVFATLDSREKETPRRTQGEAKFFGNQ